MGSSLTLRNKNQIFVSMMAISSFAFLVALTICSIVATSNNTKADSLEFSTDVSGISYTTSVVSADNLRISLNATPRGDLAIAHDTINTKTDNPSGYQLYFSMSQSTDYDASHPGNALYKDGNSTSSSFISPATGTISAPSTLANNTWGFALVGGANKQTGVPDTFSNFNDVYVDSNGNSSTGATHQTIIEDSKFAAVPLRSTAVKVQEVSEPTTSAGQDLDVYYAIKANNALPSGSYVGAVNYYALSDTPISNLDAIALSPSEISSDGGETLTIITSLYSSHVFTSQEVTITLTNKTNSSITGTCTLDSSTSTTGNVVLTCTTPALEVGDYTVSVSIPSYGKSWSKDINIVAPPNFWNITYMQDMTPEICASLYTPSNATGKYITMITDETTYKTTVTDNNQPYAVQRTLYDYRGRDGTGTKDAPATGSNMAGYTVSKLADGNCWMTSNLTISLSTSQAIEVVSNATGEAKATLWTPTGSGGASNSSEPLNGNTRSGLYTWYAATAGSGTNNTSENIDASDSICPAGWCLPSNYTINTDKSFGSITKSYFDRTNNFDGYMISTSNISKDPLNFTNSGYRINGDQYNYNNGSYWSATAHSNEKAYQLSLMNNYYSIDPQSADSKYKGYSIRCVSI